MSDDDVGKTLGTWLGKAKKISQPPSPSDARDSLSRPEQPRVGAGGRAEQRHARERADQQGSMGPAVDE